MRAIFAGNGALPFILAHYITQKHQQAPLILTVTPDYDKNSALDYPHEASDIGQLQQCFALLKKHRCQDVIFAGKIPRDYFHETAKDAMAQKYFDAIQDKGDDYAVRVACELFEAQGFNIVAPHQICPDILCKQQGDLGAHSPNAQAMADIARGKEILDALSPADVGQATVIHQGLVIGIEAIEGTNALITRCGEWLKHKHQTSPMMTGAVLVKLPKKHQTHLMDLPAIGMETIATITEYQFAGIAIQQDAMLFVGEDEIISNCDKNGLFLHALPSIISPSAS